MSKLGIFAIIFLLIIWLPVIFYNNSIIFLPRYELPPFFRGNPYRRVFLTFINYGCPLIILIIFILIGKWVVGIFLLILLISIDRMVAKYKFRRQFEREIDIWKSSGEKIDEKLTNYILEELWRRARGKYTL